MTTIIETYGLTKNYGRTVAVNNLNLNIEEGTIFGYLGLNGAGKTTTISMLVGLVHPTRGLAKIAGYDVNAERGKALRNVGYLPERPGFYENLSAQDNLVYFGMLAGLKGSRLAKRTREVTEQVGLTGQERKKVRYYSHGMRQRLGLAIALLSEPSILILDEPTTGLDPQGTREIREMIKALGKSGTTIFLSSHLLNEVQQICNVVGIIHQGNLKVVAPINEFLRHGLNEEALVEVKLDTINEVLINAVHSVPSVSTLNWNSECKVLYIKGKRRSGLVQDINTALVMAGGRVRSIKEHLPSLEEAFLKIIAEDEI